MNLFLYFLCLFPGIGEIQRATANNWGAEDAAPGNSEIVKFLGIMSRERFEKIVHYLRLDVYDPSKIAITVCSMLSPILFINITFRQDPWAPIRSFVEAFKENRHTTVVPGRTICIDELISQWEGKEAKYHPLGCPHVTKIPRKPVSCGVEGKCSCCGKSGIMLFIEFKKEKQQCVRKSTLIPSLSTLLLLCVVWRIGLTATEWLWGTVLSPQLALL